MVVQTEVKNLSRGFVSACLQIPVFFFQPVEGQAFVSSALTLAYVFLAPMEAPPDSPCQTTCQKPDLLVNFRPYFLVCAQIFAGRAVWPVDSGPFAWKMSCVGLHGPVACQLSP